MLYRELTWTKLARLRNCCSEPSRIAADLSACYDNSLVFFQRTFNPDLMTSKTVTTNPVPVSTAMLEQIAGLDAKSISPETARHLLDLSFSRSHQQQVDALSQKARAGSLTPAERAELDEFIRVADLLAILQSRARQALKRAGLAT